MTSLKKNDTFHTDSGKQGWPASFSLSNRRVSSTTSLAQNPADFVFVVRVSQAKQVRKGQYFRIAYNVGLARKRRDNLIANGLIQSEKTTEE